MREWPVAAFYLLIIIACVGIYLFVNAVKEESCEAKGEQKVCLSPDGRLLK